MGAGWQQVVFDGRDLTFIDSTGLSLLLRAEREAGEHGGTFALADGSPVIARLLEVAGLAAHFRPADVSWLSHAPVAVRRPETRVRAT